MAARFGLAGGAFQRVGSGRYGTPTTPTSPRPRSSSLPYLLPSTIHGKEEGGGGRGRERAEEEGMRSEEGFVTFHLTAGEECVLLLPLPLPSPLLSSPSLLHSYPGSITHHTIALEGKAPFYRHALAAKSCSSEVILVQLPHGCGPFLLFKEYSGRFGTRIFGVFRPAPVFIQKPETA
ncbi:hypothetical protein C4D60_Mb05t29750 [Musa balbisiana]|uniref:Uncharacterized protein n=1 Tax=Musa balbisiana TaxID=52838 RepID=A0A4V4H8J1_MUSBA|nr:hypothetical protein C4D60_Mb05t29750 [Musa balbisiana]